MRNFFREHGPDWAALEHRHHHLHHGHRDGDPHRGGRRGRGWRMPRGDVRTAVLMLLSEQPMHGYQLMRAIGERTAGRWRPSPGAVYPTINQLEDEGLVTVTASSGRRLVELTEQGRAHVAEQPGDWADPFAPFAGQERSVDLRAALEDVHGAVRQVGRAGTEQQIDAAARILADTRKALYLLLAEGPEEGGE